MTKEATLVLGANSFIARYFIEKIEGSVIGTTRSEELDLDKRVTLISGFDYSQRSIWRLLSEYKPQRVVNFIGSRGGDEKNNLFEFLFNINCGVTQKLLEAVRTINEYNPKIVIIGSAAEYGLSDNESQSVFTESSIAKPSSFYGLTKLIQTNISLYYHQAYGQKINVVRLSNVIGVGLPSGLVFTDILNQILAGENEVLVGDLSPVRDFISVDDAVKAINIVLDKEISGEIINISSGRGVTLSKLAKIVADFFKDKTGREIKFKLKDSRTPNPNYSLLDNTKLFNLTGFKPSSDIGQWLIKILNKAVEIS